MKTLVVMLAVLVATSAHAGMRKSKSQLASEKRRQEMVAQAEAKRKAELAAKRKAEEEKRIDKEATRKAAERDAKWAKEEKAELAKTRAAVATAAKIAEFSEKKKQLEEERGIKTVTSSEYAHAWDKNMFHAEKAFVGKDLFVLGRITSFYRLDDGSPCVILDNRIVCRCLKTAKGQVAKLEKGRTVVIYGKGHPMDMNTRLLAVVGCVPMSR